MSFYVYLNSIWRRERQNLQLIELEEDFFKRTQVYLQYLENQSTSVDNDELTQSLFFKRLEHARFLINDIIKLRINKHSREILHCLDVDNPNLRYQEEDFRRKLRNLIDEFKRKIIDLDDSIEIKATRKLNEKNSQTDIPTHYFNSLNLQFIREEQKQQLTTLDNNFYGNVHQYLGLLTNNSTKLQLIEKQILETRLETVKKMINDFIDLRISKHFFEKLSEEFIPQENRFLPPEEEDFRSELDMLVKNFKESVFEDTEFEEENLDENQLIELIKADNDEHTGPDGKFYGPFKAGDIIYVPMHLAKFLVQYSKAKYLNV